MEQRGKITLPSVTEIDEVIAYSRENELGLPEVSDFAMASVTVMAFGMRT